MATYFGGLPPLIIGDEALVDRVTFFFDPDDDEKDEFVNRVHSRLEGLSTASPPWIASRNEPDLGRWTLARAGEPSVELRGIPWGAAGPVLDGLDDVQNLERLLCAVMGKAYPDQVARIAGWLDEIREFRASLHPGQRLKWKAAVLLWAALTDEQSTTDGGIPSRFLGQHKPPRTADFFEEYVRPELESQALHEGLAWVFA